MVLPFVDCCVCSHRRWTAEEHARFLEGIMRFGKDWKRVHTLVKTRSLTQLRTHAQKVFRKSGLLKIGVGRDVEEELRAAGYKDLQEREAGTAVGARAVVGVGLESSRQEHENETGERDDGGADEQKDGEEDDDDDDEGDLEEEDEEDEDEDERPRRRHKPDNSDNAIAVAAVAMAVE